MVKILCLCYQCDQRFCRNESLHRHIQSKHGLNGIYVTSVNRNCKKKFVSERNCNIHVDKIHKGHKKFSCEDCGHQTMRKQDMKSHMKIYERDPVICVLCGSQLKNNYRLKQHIDSQHHPGNLKCEVCCKNLADKYDLRLHKKLV